MSYGRDYAYLCYHVFLGSSVPELDFKAPQHWRRADGSIHPPDTVLPNGQSTYGHEACVFRAVATFLTKELGIPWENSESPSDGGSETSKVLLGSGASNVEVQPILGRPERPQFGTSECKLHYSIGQEPAVLRRWQYGDWTTPNAHTICDSDGKPLLRPESRGGEQVDDYLLVTRLPGSKPGTAVTIFAGLHGPGTRSAERMFSSLRFRDLTELASRIDLKPSKVPYFQAVFRASNLQRNLPNDPTDSDVATEIELVTSVCPPRILV